MNPPKSYLASILLLLYFLLQSITHAQNGSFFSFDKVVRKAPQSEVNYETWKKDRKIRESVVNRCINIYRFDKNQIEGKPEDSNIKSNPIGVMVEYSRVYGLAFTQCSNYYEFRKEMLISVNADFPFGEDIMWLIPSQRPNNIGDVYVPVLHLALEVPSEREGYIRYLMEYYVGFRKKPDVWLDILNAKNTKGYTFLDYAEFLKQSNQVLASQQKSFSALVEFVSKEGGVYSRYRRDPNNPDRLVLQNEQLEVEKK